MPMRSPESARPRPRPEPKDGARLGAGIIAYGAPGVEAPIQFNWGRLAGEFGYQPQESGRPHARVMPPDGRRAREARP